MNKIALVVLVVCYLALYVVWYVRTSKSVQYCLDNFEVCEERYGK